jgi:hypothetical protein
MAPQEVAGLQALAMKHGGSLTINPDTGLPEAGFLKKLLPMIAGFALGPAGFGLMSAGMAGLTVGAVTGLATGDLSKGLVAGLGAYGGAGLGQSLMGAGTGALSAEAGNAALSNAGLTGEAALSAQADQVAQNAIGSKLAAATPMDTLGAGFNAITKDPSALGKFAANNYQYGLAAMAPTLADQGVSTVTKIPNNGLIRNFDYDPMTQRAKALNPVRVTDLGYADGGLTNLKNYADGGSASDGSSQAAYDYLMGRTNTTRPNTPVNPYTPEKIYMPNLASTTSTTSGGITDLNTAPLDTVTTNTGVDTTTDATYNVDTTDTTGADNLTEYDTDGGEDTRDQDAITAVEQAVADDALAESAAATDIDNATIGTESQQADAALAESAAATDIDNATIAVDNQPAVQDTIDGGAVVTMPEDNYVPPEVADTFNPDTNNYVEVGDAAGDYGDFGGGGGGGTNAGMGGGEFGGGNYMSMFDDQAFARGGMLNYATGGLGSLGGYSDGGRLLRGPGDGVSDSIPATIGNKQPARLADGEFVVPARIVSELGNGSTEAGARKLYQMMDRIQAARGKTVGKGRVAKNSRAEKHLPA